MERPNVLFLHTDQQRADTIGAAGNAHILTPNLDALAGSGTLFENAFSNNPVCMPSRQSMFSGQYPSVMGTGCNGIEMPGDVLTIHKVLGRCGYRTASLGKLHFLNHSNRDHRMAHPDYGFDEIIVSDEPGCYDDAYIKWVAQRDPSQVENCRCSTPPAWRGRRVEKHPRNTHEPYLFEGPEHLTHTAFVADITRDFIRRQGNDPFFCFAGFYLPHCPLNPPKRFVDMYDPATLPLPAMNEGEDRYGLSDEEWRKVKQYYYACVTHVDEEVGNILKTLDEQGLREKTLIIFTSDHGEYLGDHGLIQKGPPGHECIMHVPLIVAWPGGVKASKREELVELIDLAPTILDCCGVQTPPEFQGRSLRGLPAGTDYTPRRSAYLEYRMPGVESWRGVRTHEFRYLISAGGEELLFDLDKDPHELTNVAADANRREALHLMRRELIRRMFDAENPFPLRTGDY